MTRGRTDASIAENDLLSSGVAFPGPGGTFIQVAREKDEPEAEDDEPGVQIRDAGIPAYLDAGIRPAVGVGIYLGGEQALNGFPYIYDGRRPSSQTFLFAESHSNNILYLSCVTGSCNYTSL